MAENEQMKPHRPSREYVLHSSKIYIESHFQWRIQNVQEEGA